MDPFSRCLGRPGGVHLDLASNPGQGSSRRESYWAKPPGCPLKGTPLSCEIDATMPRYAMVMLGTNDIGMDMLSASSLAAGSSAASAAWSGPARPESGSRAEHDPADHPAGRHQARRGHGRCGRSNAGIFELARKWHLPMINL